MLKADNHSAYNISVFSSFLVNNSVNNKSWVRLKFSQSVEKLIRKKKSWQILSITQLATQTIAMYVSKILGK